MFFLCANSIEFPQGGMSIALGEKAAEKQKTQLPNSGDCVFWNRLRQLSKLFFLLIQHFGYFFIKQHGEYKTDDLGNYGGKPYVGQNSGEGEKPCEGEQKDNKAAKVDEKRIVGTSERLEGGAYYNGNGADGDGDAANSHGGDSDFDHIGAGVEEIKQGGGDELIEHHNRSGNDKTHNEGELKRFADAVDFSRAKVIGEDGDGAVIHTEDRHKYETLKFESVWVLEQDNWMWQEHSNQKTWEAMKDLHCKYKK